MFTELKEKFLMWNFIRKNPDIRIVKLSEHLSAESECVWIPRLTANGWRAGRLYRHSQLHVALHAKNPSTYDAELDVWNIITWYSMQDIMDNRLGA